MCGIAGFCDFTFGSSEDLVLSMRDELVHRGPDDGGHYWRVTETFQLGLAHRRLSIIDLSDAAHQPMHSSCGGYCIVFNGEVYNYKSIREELLQRGEKFLTNSDTEVILNAYRFYGDEFINRLKGMFAFVIYDKINDKLIAARDRMGVKPFYYYFDGKIFLFASEVKALLKHPKIKKIVNPEALVSYLQFGYVSGDQSIFQNIKRLKQGSTLVLHFEKKVISIESYWSVNTFFEKQKLKLSYDDFQVSLLEKLKQAIQYRLVADVPVGLFLSGGYDSTLVASLLTKELNVSIDTFTMGFSDEEIDESKLAQKIANHLGTKHHGFQCTETDALRMVTFLPKVFDEPFADPSSIPTLLLCQQTSNYVKVALSADGGDESFFGYNRYASYLKRILQTQSVTRSTFFSKFVKQAFSGLEGKYATMALLSGEIERYLVLSSSHLKQSQIKNLIDFTPLTQKTEPFALIDDRDMIQRWDLNQYLPDDILVKVDRSSMSFGLEAREPLLDQDLFEFVAQVSLDFKFRDNTLKYPLKSIVHQYVPESWINQPKRGFSPPLSSWMKTIFKNDFEELTSESYLRSQGIFDPAMLQSIMSNFEEDYLRYRFAWSIFTFQKWYTHWMQ